MAGRLVGEVFDAREAGGLLDKLSAVDLLALLAIAEGCREVSRQGEVPMSRIGAAMGRSASTAKRAVSKLTGQGLVRVVKHGYTAHGEGHAKVYQLTELGPSRVSHAHDGGVALAGTIQDEPCSRAEQGAKSTEQGSPWMVHIP
jgi:DNA-binding MarR family transcriptional regulator